jgi:hypothetical protein
MHKFEQNQGHSAAQAAIAGAKVRLRQGVAIMTHGKKKNYQSDKIHYDS